MSNGHPRDALAALYPAPARDMPVAWHQVRIPAPPPGFELDRSEREHPDPRVRYRRRTIQILMAGGEHLAMVDKASPHALHDLMLSGLSTPPLPGPGDVSPRLGRALWLTAAGFVHFVSRPEVLGTFGLQGGQLHLAINCDPNTRDRESCQENKQFHLHLLHWTARELAPLARPNRLSSITDLRLRRQALDPLAFLGAGLIRAALADLPLGIPGAAILPRDDRAGLSAGRPLGCVLRLPGWQVIETPRFEELIRCLDQRITRTAMDLLAAFTARREPPRTWQRHNLLPRAEIKANLSRLSLPPDVALGLELLADRLRNLTASAATHFARGPAGRRKHHVSLNQPCYSLNLYAPVTNQPDRPLNKAREVWLILQTKLFSGIGGAGLLSLHGIPSVRILRGAGTFSAQQWHHRTRFQREFALFNRDRLAGEDGITCEPVRHFADTARGWV